MTGRVAHKTAKPKVKKAPRAERAEKARQKREKDGENIMKSRIEHIMLLMTTGKWITHVSAVDLARQWNLSPQTVKNYATHAGAHLRLQIENNGDIRANIWSQLETIRSIGIMKGDHKLALHALQVMVGAAGFFPDAKETNAELIKAENRRLAAEQKAKPVETDDRTIHIHLDLGPSAAATTTEPAG